MPQRGSGVPTGTAAAGWSSVADSALTGVATIVSNTVSLRPIHLARSGWGWFTVVSVVGLRRRPWSLSHSRADWTGHRCNG